MKPNHPLTIALAVLPALAASAQDTMPVEDVDLTLATSTEDEWDVNVQPYIWIPASIKGDSTVSGSTASLDLSFSDVIDDFDKIFAVTGRVEAWKGDWGIIFDGMYVTLESEFEVQPFTGPRQMDVTVEVDQALVDLAVGWRAYEQPLDAADPDGPRLRFDVIGGMRYQYLKQEIDLSPTTLGTSKDWVEPMIGGRASIRLNDTWTIAARADASGFGIGSASELTWSLVGGVDITFSPTFDLKLGYRLLDIDYDNGSGADEFGMDVRMHGPYIGASFRF
jgi:opacity protein-like surface antigen